MKKNDITIAEAQRHVISAILTYGSNDENVSKVLSEMRISDFDNAVYAAVFKASQELYRQGNPVDMVSVAIHMGDDILPVLTECEGLCLTTANLNYYVRLIREHRKKIAVARRFNEALEQDCYADEIIKLADELKANVSNEDYTDATIGAVCDSVKNMCAPLDQSSRIATGFLKLDKVLGKLEKGTVSIIGAYPSCGKTAFALNIINHNHRRSKNKCVLFSLEMTAGQIFERLASDRCDIDYGHIRNHELNAAEKDKIGQFSANIIKERRLIICDSIYCIEEIVRTIGEIKPDYAVIDFLHCVRAIKRCESRRTEIDYISQCLKQAAKRYSCHIIVLCQVSRPEKGIKRSPKMSDLKESGGMEQDGDYIIMLDRTYVQDKTADPCEAMVLIDKNKYGDTGAIAFRFLGHKQRFVEQIHQE